MEVYRAPMRSRLDEVPAAAGVERGLRLGLCGIGGRLSSAPRDLEEALVLTGRQWGERAEARLERFAAVAEGSWAWTRDPEGAFHVGVLAGPWVYDDHAEAIEADLVHVRACRWAVAEPPPAVIETFARGGRNFQRVRAL